MPINMDNLADYFEFLANTDLPLEDARLQADIRAYLQAQFQGQLHGRPVTPAQIQALQAAAKAALGQARKEDITRVIRRLSPTRTDIRWVIPGLRGLFGTQTLIQRARRALLQ